jgi:Flp pilus assembly protein TadG
MAEFAIVVPALLMAFLGLMEGGYYAFTVTTVEHATQEGARLAALPSTSGVSAIRARVQSAAVGVTIVTENINVYVYDGATNGAKTYAARVQGDKVKVTTTWAYQPLVGRLIPRLTFTLTANAEYRAE